MQITRHFVDIGGCRVHYRRCGNGPPLLMVHQSPRSSAEYEPLMRDWGRYFTCIAPDTPGFGQSDALPGDPDIAGFADALVATMDAIGLPPCPAYGFHSGGIILVTALRRYPTRFTALAIGGYAVWTDAERAAFDTEYLPPLQPQPFGEHLAWLWNRVLEQSWFFPWYDARAHARLPGAHDDVARVAAVVIELLESGDAYRAGYGAVLRARRDIPAPDAPSAPVLITAYTGDPLQAHLERLGTLPASWRAYAVADPATHQAASRQFLRDHRGGACPVWRETADRGFVRVATDSFNGLVHYNGNVVDPPGHGLSDDFLGAAPTTWTPWRDVLAAVGRSVTLPPLPVGDPDRLYPDLTPDRFGAYLAKAWQIARARVLFAPWYEVSAATAIEFASDQLAPDALARDHLSILRARAARALHIARASAEGTINGNS